MFWKIKGITAKTTYRLFMKYGDPNTAEKNDIAKQFANKVMLNYSIPLLESHVTLLLQREKQFVGSKALNFAIKFCSQAIKRPNTMEKLKPLVENILFNVVIPIMYITENDLATFENDPIEYIRR